MTGALLALLLSGAPELNSEGFELYKAKKYGEALQKFRDAITADQSHALAHYNLAATLGLLRKQGRVCDFDAYQQTILEHLTTSVQLDDRRRARMQRDADFDSVRDSLGYQRLLGRDPANDKDVRTLLVELTFLSQSQGAFGQTTQLDLKADGTLTISQLVIGDDVKKVVSAGTWKSKGRAVTVSFKKKIFGVSSATGTFNAEGHLVFETPAWDLSSDRSDCDA